MIIRIISGIILIALIEYFFFRTLGKSITALFPDKAKTVRKFIPWTIIYFNLYPVFLIVMLIYSLAAGVSFSVPDSFILDYLLIYPFWFFFILAVQTILLLILFDILKLILKPFVGKKVKNISALRSTVFIFLLAIFAVYIPGNFIYDYYTIGVTDIAFSKSSLPQALRGFRIALISDVQADRYTDSKRLGNFVNKVNSLKPDLILIGGDMITGSPEYIGQSAGIMKRLTSQYGVYSCVGDHDNWAYRYDTKRSLREVKEKFSAVQIPLLDNQNVIIPVDTAQIFISAVTNTYVEKINDKSVDSLIADNEGDLKIFLTHQPRRRLMDKALAAGYDIYLCGHTHGGQITFFFPFFNLSVTSIETPFVRGEFDYNGLFVYVTRGLGMSIAPVRYNSSPEITMITLSNKE